MSDPYTVVATAIRNGILARPELCEICGTTEQIIAHHWSYAREHWLDVIPLCKKCHRRVHAGLTSEPRTGRVYTLDKRITSRGPMSFRFPEDVAAHLAGQPNATGLVIALLRAHAAGDVAVTFPEPTVKMRPKPTARAERAAKTAARKQASAGEGK